MNKTWFHYLPEIGRQIERNADNLVYKKMEIDRLKKQVKQLEEGLKKAEIELYNEVKKDWSEDEIEKAISDLRNEK